jgi:hypothetical protein
MNVLKECDALMCGKGGLHRSRSSKLESFAEVARFNKFGAPKLEGLSRWVGSMMVNCCQSSQRRLVMIVEAGIDWGSEKRR